MTAKFPALARMVGKGIEGGLKTPLAFQAGLLG